MNFEEHVELRNNLYQTSLKLFHCNIEWLSEYIPSVSKWRIKVLLKNDLTKVFRELDNSDPTSINVNNANIQNFSLNNYKTFENQNTSVFEDSLTHDISKFKTVDINDSLLHNDQFFIQYTNSSQVNNSSSASEACGQFEMNESNNDDLHACNVEKRTVIEKDCLEKETGIELSNLNRKNDRKVKNSQKKVNTYNIITGNDGENHDYNAENHLISTYGRTLWEYLPLVALLNGCTGIFILLRLSSVMYRFSILSCTISHLITFIFIGIPLSQMEFALRKKGKKYGLLQIMQSLNPKFIGLTILSLITTIIIFIYSFQIIGTLSVVIYNIPKAKWKINYEDVLICNRINNSVIKRNQDLGIVNSRASTEELNNAYAICSYSSVCDVLLPFFEDSNSVNNVGPNYKSEFNMDEIITKEKNFLFPILSKFVNSTNFIKNSEIQNSTTNLPNWCVPSSSKKLRNLMVMQQSNYRESLYFSLNSAIYNSEKIIDNQVFPLKKPLNRLTPNLYAQIIGLSISFICVIFSINGVGKIFRLISFLSFLSLITLLLTATIQIVASDIQLNIFISIIVTQDGVENLLSPSIWYYSINNTLLFFGISFLITMFPLNDLGSENINYQETLFSKRRFQNINSIQSGEFKRSDIKLRKHISKIYRSVYNRENEGSNFHDKPNNNKSIPKKSHNKEKIEFVSLKSAVNSSMFFLACILLSSIVVIISNAALISLSESTNTHVMLPFNHNINETTNLKNRDLNLKSNFDYIKNEDENYLATNKIFPDNKWLMHKLYIPDEDHKQKIFQMFNGDSASIEEISFLKSQLFSWFKWNLLQIKAQSSILGEYMIIYLIIIAIELSKRIPTGVVIFFVLIIFSYAVCSASICASVISKHISILFNRWVLPHYSNKLNFKEKRQSVKHTRKTLSKMELNTEHDSKNKKKPENSKTYNIKCFFKVTFHIIYILLIYIRIKLLNFFGINFESKRKKRIKRLTFLIQFIFILFLIILVFSINIISVFIPRFPFDNEDINTESVQEQLNASKMLFLDSSEKNELWKFNNGELYVAKTATVLFGSLLDIRLISNTANLMLSLTAGLEVTIITWYLYNDVQKKIVGRKAMKLHYIGYITSTTILSIGFLLGNKFIFLSCLLLSFLFYLIFFFVSRSYARINFNYEDDLVIKRQKYHPTWWLCISNIDILRRKWNSQEFIDAGLLSFYSEKTLINDNNFIKVSNYNQVINIANKNDDNFELIKEISNFNLYCNVRSHQPQFLGFWFILAKYFTTILTISTLPLTIINSIYILLFRSDCLDGAISEIILYNYISKMDRKITNFFDQVSIFQLIQVLIIFLIEFIGIFTTIFLTFYIYKRQKKVETIKKLDINDEESTKNSKKDVININIDNILDDVYESLKVPMCAELYSTKRIEKLGKMPQSLIISFALLENSKLLNK